MAKATSRFIFVEFNATGGILLEPFPLLVTLFRFLSPFRPIHTLLFQMHGTKIERQVKRDVEVFNRLLENRLR